MTAMYVVLYRGVDARVQIIASKGNKCPGNDVMIQSIVIYFNIYIYISKINP